MNRRSFLGLILCSALALALPVKAFGGKAKPTVKVQTAFGANDLLEVKKSVSGDFDRERNGRLCMPPRMTKVTQRGYMRFSRLPTNLDVDKACAIRISLPFRLVIDPPPSGFVRVHETGQFSLTDHVVSFETTDVLLPEFSGLMKT